MVKSTGALLSRGQSAAVPALYAPNLAAAKRFVEYFAANIRNVNTRRAYLHAVREFADWCALQGFHEIVDIEPLHVAGYIEQLTKRLAKPSVKQHLAAIRMLFDWLVVGQIVTTNPAAPVRGPKYTVNAYFAQGRPSFHGKPVHGFTPCRSSAHEAGRGGLSFSDEHSSRVWISDISSMQPTANDDRGLRRRRFLTTWRGWSVAFGLSRRSSRGDTRCERRDRGWHPPKSDHRCRRAIA